MSSPKFAYPPNVPQDLTPYAEKAGTAFTGTIVSRSIRPSTSVTDSIGNSTYYYFAMYAQRYYVNTTAYLNGITAGILAVVGKMTFQASTTTLASLNVPTGVAPTSPVVGDVYSDGTHIYCYLAGSWKQLDA